MDYEILVNKTHGIDENYYKEVIGYYRAHIDELDIPLLLEYVELFPKKKLITKTIQLEVL